jgi:hypothetical protein
MSVDVANELVRFKEHFGSALNYKRDDLGGWWSPKTEDTFNGWLAAKRDAAKSAVPAQEGVMATYTIPDDFLADLRPPESDLGFLRKRHERDDVTPLIARLNDTIAEQSRELATLRAEVGRYREALEWVSRLTEDGYCDNLYSIETIANTATEALKEPK